MNWNTLIILICLSNAGMSAYKKNWQATTGWAVAMVGQIRIKMKEDQQ